MLDYEQSIIVDAPADQVFAFVSNLNNLPKFVPALRPGASVMVTASSDLDVAPSKRGSFHDCAAGGYFRVQPTEYFMEWCAEAGQHCTGWLEVEEFDEGCEVTVHVSFHPDPALAARMRAQSPDLDADMKAELAAVMATIKQLCEESAPQCTPFTGELRTPSF